MNPGKLIHTGVLSAPAVTAGADGEPVSALEAYATVKVAIATQGGREYYAARQVNSEINHNLTIWRRWDVLPGHVMTVEVPNANPAVTRVFNLIEVNNSDETPRDTVIFAREVNASVA